MGVCDSSTAAPVQPKEAESRAADSNKCCARCHRTSKALISPATGSPVYPRFCSGLVLARRGRKRGGNGSWGGRTRRIRRPENTIRRVAETREKGTYETSCWARSSFKADGKTPTNLGPWGTSMGCFGVVPLDRPGAAASNVWMPNREDGGAGSSSSHSDRREGGRGGGAWMGRGSASPLEGLRLPGEYVAGRSLTRGMSSELSAEDRRCRVGSRRGGKLRR